MYPIFRFITPFRREFLTVTRLERVTHGLRRTALLGRARSCDNRHGKRSTELWRGPLTLHGDNHPREIPTALGRGQSTSQTLMRQCPTFAYTDEAQRQRSPGPVNQYNENSNKYVTDSDASPCWAILVISN